MPASRIPTRVGGLQICTLGGDFRVSLDSKADQVIVVSVDGGCEGVANVGKGVIAATSQQYPLKMAAMGVAAGVEYAKTGKKASGYVDTGVALIAAKAVPGVDSQSVKVGTDLCWGKK